MSGKHIKLFTKNIHDSFKIVKWRNSDFQHIFRNWKHVHKSKMQKKFKMKESTNIFEERRIHKFMEMTQRKNRNTYTLEEPHFPISN